MVPALCQIFETLNCNSHSLLSYCCGCTRRNRTTSLNRTFSDSTDLDTIMVTSDEEAFEMLNMTHNSQDCPNDNSNMESETEEPSSMGSIVHIRASETFPKKLTSSESPPFALLSGEYVEYQGRTSVGIIAITNYRFYVQFKYHFYNIPLGLIEQVDLRDIFYLYISLKDAKTYRCTFATGDQCQEWHRRLLTATSAPKKIEDVFAFAYYAWYMDENPNDVLPAVESTKSMFSEEVERLGFDIESTWRISKANENFTLCPSYPAEILVPSLVEDKELVKLSIFRSSKRIPAVVWRHRGNGCVIARCSQPEMGWMGWRNNDDEKLIQCIGISCGYDPGVNIECQPTTSEVPCINPATDPKNLTLVNGGRQLRTLIIDARSYAAAFTNRAKGGGYECPEYYPNCDIVYMNLANIHSIRKSFQSVRNACATQQDQQNWLSILDNTKWLQHASGLLKAALSVVNAVDRETRPVVVHCSDGWDRTSQIVGLAELMLDPYYRTMKGFQVLVEKEWLEFGHKFSDRCGQGMHSEDTNERCPIFLQWLDCVHQLLHQFPVSFEFNQIYLIKLAQHTYSCLYGTFLCNNSQERKKSKVQSRTFSAWSYLHANAALFKNYLYTERDTVLRPSFHVKDLMFWSSLYVQNLDFMPDAGDFSVENRSIVSAVDSEDRAGTSGLDSNQNPTPEEPNGGACASLSGATTSGAALPKTKSCTDLQSVHDHEVAVDKKRRLSDSSSNLLLGSTEKLPNEENDLHYDTDINTSKLNGYGICRENLTSDQSDLEETTSCTPFMNGTVDDDDDSASETLAIDKELTLNVETLASDNEDSDSENSSNVEICGPKLIETSTDTLVGELTENGIENYSQTVCHESVSKQEESVQISTSTSEISDSTVRLSNGNCIPASVSSVVTNVSCNNCNYLLSTQNGNITSVMSPGIIERRLEGDAIYNDDVQQRLHNVFSEQYRHKPSGTGIHSPNSNLSSRTPSSGFPATPSEERGTEVPRSCSTFTSSIPAASIAGISMEKKLDADGLSAFNDEVQQRLHSLVIEHQYYKEKESQLQYMLTMTQKIMSQQLCQKCSNLRGNAEASDEVGSLPDSIGSCSSEQQSVGHDSFAASDLSWETVDEQETRPTLWEPDHVVNRCPSCDHEFCLMRRKHHCRSCGRIFCSDCSNQEMPVPNEQFYDPVRVCYQCFRELRCRQQVSMVPSRLFKPIYVNGSGTSN